MSHMFNRQAFDAALEKVAREYQQTAPTVEQWADMLSAAPDDEIRLADVALLQRLSDETPPHQLAANLVYHLCHRVGRNLFGQVGF